MNRLFNVLYTACLLLFTVSLIQGGGVIVSGVWWLVGVLVFGALALVTTGGRK